MEWARNAIPRYQLHGVHIRAIGALQLTGREKYTDFTTFYNKISGKPPKDFTKTPDDLKNDFDIAIHAGLWYFQKNVLKEIPNFQKKATNSSSLIRDGLTIKVSTIVNGESHALGDRINKFEDSKNAIKNKNYEKYTYNIIFYFNPISKCIFSR